MWFRSTTSFEAGFFLCDLSARVLSRTLDVGCWAFDVQSTNRQISMRMTVTYYLDVISSLCFFAEPAWAESTTRYEPRGEFLWTCALTATPCRPTSRQKPE